MPYVKRSPSGHGRVNETERLTLSEAIELTGEQIEIECFSEKDKKQVKEICLVIAEMYILPSAAEVRIGGISLTADAAAEVYRHLTHEHIVMVLENLNEIKYKVKHIKTYIRTALYNSVFEYESRYDNDFKTEGGV